MKTKFFLPFTLLLSTLTIQAQWSRLDSITHGNLYMVHFENADTGFTYNESATLRKTTDGGHSWDTVDVDFDGYIMDMDFASSNVGYAVGGAWFPFGKYFANAIIKTTDGGATWDSVYGNYIGGVFNSVAALSDNEFYAAGETSILHSADGGTTFDTVTVSSILYERYYKVQFTDASTGFILGGSYLGAGIYMNTLYKTANGGLTWQPVYSDTVSAASSRDFVMTAPGNGLLTGMKGQVIRTNNGGNTWQIVQLADTSLHLNRVTEINGDVYAIGSNLADTTSGLYRSRDWGTSWQAQFTVHTSMGGLIDMSFPTQAVGYFTTWQEVYKNDHLVSIGAEPSPLGFKLYPNPTSSQVFVQLTEHDETEVTIMNAFGQKVGEASAQGSSHFHLDVSHLPAGFYLIEVIQGGNRLVKRLVKE